MSDIIFNKIVVINNEELYEFIKNMVKCHWCSKDIICNDNCKRLCKDCNNISCRECLLICPYCSHGRSTKKICPCNNNKCSFCYKSLCRGGHLLTCGCGVKICKNCTYGKCKTCSFGICKDCFKYYEETGYKQCVKCAEYCSICNTIINIKDDYYKHCSQCNNKICSFKCYKSCSFCHSINCNKCNKDYPQCQLCECQTCCSLIKCENCDNSICKFHAKLLCGKCSKYYCYSENFYEYCKICNDSYCLNCAYINCKTCGFSCPNHSSSTFKCKNCNEGLCLPHGSNKTCIICKEIYCRKCRKKDKTLINFKENTGYFCKKCIK